jgi:hypothetical protein
LFPSSWEDFVSFPIASLSRQQPIVWKLSDLLSPVEVVGFGARVINANQDPVSRGVYIIQALGILLAPSFFSASIYMEFGRIILLVSGEELAIIKKKWLTKLFVTGDIISFLAQLAGRPLPTHDQSV